MFDFQPVGPNSATGCSAGRQCLPPNGYRLDDFVEISGAVDGSGKLYVTWADGRNIAATCQGSAATATPPCDNDVFYSFSTNGGATWSAAAKLTPAGSAQWMPWSAVAPDGSTLFVAYYDRSYGNCEQTGCNDITLARVANPASASPNVSYVRVTTSSMPNLLPSNNPLEAGFLGDYMYMAVDAKGFANIVWSDTRSVLVGSPPLEIDGSYQQIAENFRISFGHFLVTKTRRTASSLGMRRVRIPPSPPISDDDLRSLICRRGRVSARWFDQRSEQCEDRAGRRGGAHGGPERGARGMTGSP